MKDKEKELTAVIETVLRETKNCDMSIETLTDYLVDRIKNKVIIEDSVVLTREEYERLKLELAIEKKRADESYTQKEVEEIIASKERIKSKETAEKIMKDFKLWAREYQNKDIIIDDNGERPMTNNEKLNYLYTYLCDKYEVEIKE